MDKLPLEVKQLVCSFLGPNELKPLRLTSKVFASAAIPHFIPRIFLFNHPDSCAEVREIVAHQELKNSMNTVVIDPRRLCYFDDFEAWVESMPAHWRIPCWSDYEPNFLPEPDIDGIIQRWNEAMKMARENYLEDFRKARYSESELRTKWEHYRILQGKQKDGYMKQYLTSTIRYIFQRCPNAENLVITSGHHSGSAVASNREKLFHTILPEFSLMYSYAQALSPASYLDFGDIVVCSRLSTLTILHVDFDGLECDWDMSSLRHLRISLRAHEKGPNAVFDRILRSAHRLETLRIDITAEYGRAYGFTSTLKAVTLKNLTECLLVGFSISEDDLVNFLLRHATSLETIGLGRIKLGDGTWPSLFRRLSCCLPVLKQMAIVDFAAGPDYENEYAACYRHAVQNYILTGGPEPREVLTGDDGHDEDDEDDDEEDDSSRMEFAPLVTRTQKGLWKDIHYVHHLF